MYRYNDDNRILNRDPSGLYTGFSKKKCDEQLMKIILTHPTGNQNVRAIIKSLSRADMLHEFNTTIALNAESILLKSLPASIYSELSRRSFSIPHNQIRTHSFREFSRIALPRLGFKSSVQHETGWASVDAVYQSMDKSVSKRILRKKAREQIHAVYSYEDGALCTFTAAKSIGIKCIYDLPIAYWQTGRKLMTEEADRLPGWAKTLGGGIKDSPAKLERKTRELELADLVVVPSEFVFNSLPDAAIKKQTIIAPFGSPDILSNIQWNNIENKQVTGPLRVLFIGSMSQRKGLADLFKAMRILNRKDIELIVMGSLQAPLEFYKKEYSNFTYLPGRSHEQVLELMRSCDVFCLPSIVEGRALVMQEAMSQGLPLIITPNTGGADLVMEGCTGFLVPIRSAEVIANKLMWFLEHRNEISKMGKMAQEHAAKYSWEKYGMRIIEKINNSFNS